MWYRVQSWTQKPQHCWGRSGRTGTQASASKTQLAASMKQFFCHVYEALMCACSVPHWTSEWVVMTPSKRIKNVVLLAVVVATCNSCRNKMQLQGRKDLFGLGSGTNLLGKNNNN